MPPEVRRRTGMYVTLLVALLALLGGLLFLLAKEVGLVGAGAESNVKIVVPNVVGADQSSAKATLEAAELTVTIVEENNAADPEIVFEQNPPAEARVDKNSEVIIKVSLGQKQVTVPNVVGRSRAAAESALEQAGFKVAVAEDNDDDTPLGNVIRQNPAANSQVGEGATVEITISSGEETFTVPNVVGDAEDEAVDTLRNDEGQFKVATTREFSDSVVEGRVIRTTPAPGATVAKGATVTIVVSTRPRRTGIGDRAQRDRQDRRRGAHAADRGRLHGPGGDHADAAAWRQRLRDRSGPQRQHLGPQGLDRHHHRRRIKLVTAL